MAVSRSVLPGRSRSCLNGGSFPSPGQGGIIALPYRDRNPGISGPLLRKIPEPEFQLSSHMMGIDTHISASRSP